MKNLLKAILPALLLVCSAAYADVVGEIGAGKCRFSKAPDGYWYQEGFPYHLELDTECFGIGIKTDAPGPLSDMFGWHHYLRFGYEYLGTVHSHAEATSTDPDFYRYKAGDLKNPHMSHWFGKGDVQGFYGIWEPTTKVGGYEIFADLGISLYYARWRCEIPDMVDWPGQTPHWVVAQHKARWDYSLITGFGVKFGKWRVSFTQQKADAKGDEFPAVWSGPVRKLMLWREF